MKERPILMSAPMVRAILDGRKTQTRRVIKDPRHNFNQYNKGLSIADIVAESKMNLKPNFRCPYGQVGDKLWCKTNYYLLNEGVVPSTDILYRLTDDRISAILTSSEVQNGRYKTDEWCPSQSYPNLPQRGLHGGVGWSNLLTNKIQRLWAEGVRGLVSAQRTPEWQGVYGDNYEPSESQSHKEYSPLDMYGFSWDATIPIISGQAFRREQQKQHPVKPEVGNTDRKLDGQGSSRARNEGRKAPNGKTDKFRDGSPKMGDRKEIGEPETSIENAWDVPGWSIRYCSSSAMKLCPSIFMPRWASRITLEITEVRVQRVQEITLDDCKAEGIHGYTFVRGCLQENPPDPRWSFIELWDSINGKKYPWASNPYVWCLTFKVLVPAQRE